MASNHNHRRRWPIAWVGVRRLGLLAAAAALLGASEQSGWAGGKDVALPAPAAIPAEPVMMPKMPAKLELSKWEWANAPLPKHAVGGGPKREGFVGAYGAFSLGPFGWSANLMVKGTTSPHHFFVDASLWYGGEYTDPVTKIAGSLFKMEYNEVIRYFLFSNKNLPPVNGFVQRQVIVYGKLGEPLLVMNTNYAIAP
jgi:hypothetical protein